MNHASLLISLVPLIIIGGILLAIKALLGGKKKPSGFPNESNLRLLTVVETKLWRNPEAVRQAISQVIDYE